MDKVAVLIDLIFCCGLYIIKMTDKAQFLTVVSAQGTWSYSIYVTKEHALNWRGQRMIEEAF